MSAHRYIDRICAAAAVLALLLTTALMRGEALGIRTTGRVWGYETRLFDPSRVHTIDLVLDDWDGFIENCTSEEYASCAAAIDGETYRAVGIRGKGNTSLTTVASLDSRRYSFKIEFDHYDPTESYHGLDKLSLNNIIQDSTYMKDYLAYRMMGAFGADAPLCSFAYITVNGEDWGLYLAVEGVEDSFLRRTYGNDHGDLYKPDSTGFGGGGPGNGRDFDFNDFFNDDGTIDTDAIEERIREAASGTFPGVGDADPAEIAQAIGDALSSGTFGGPPDMGGSFGGGPMMGGGPPDMGGFPGGPPDMDGGGQDGPPDTQGASSDGMDGMGGMPGMPGPSGGTGSDGRSGGRRGGGPGGGMGSDDVKLKYIDDDPDSYSNIFSNAKTEITDADAARLIASLKALSEGADIEDAVDVDEVLRYFVVHDYVCNGDSYTGSIIHNYYLYEKDGKLSMIPWDYNLAFGTFRSADAESMVNDPIDTPLSVSDPSDRPMFGWIMSDETYLSRYHAYLAEFLDTVDAQGLIADARDLIAPYVEKDPTAFYTYDEFVKAVETLGTFCALRTESVRGQLDGTIPSTDEGQAADRSALIDASGLALSDMGSMGMGGGGGGPMGGGGRMGGGRGGRPGQDAQIQRMSRMSMTADAQVPSDGQIPDMGQIPDGVQVPSDGQGPGMGQIPSGGQAQVPGGGQANGGDGPPGQGGGPGGMRGGSAPQDGTGTTDDPQTWILLGVSLAVLAAGLLAAWKYRSRL